MPKSLLTAVSLILALTPVFSSSAFSQENQSTVRNFPTRLITLVVPYAPGNTDILARIYLTQINQNTDWNFTYDYKPGASGSIGTAYVAKAPADGHTLLMMSSSLTMGHLLKRPLPYDWRKDFAPVFQLTKTPGILLINPNLPVKSLSDYIAYAKANPGKVNYAISGSGSISHLAGAWLHRLMGVDVTYVPYKGWAAIATAMVRGEAHAAHPTYKAFQPYITAEKLLPLAITSANGRIKQLPRLKSIAEDGLPEFDYTIWMGMFLPGATPVAIVNRMNAEFAKAAKSPDLIKKFEELGEGLNTGPSSPEDFKRLVHATGDRLTKIVKETGIELDD